MAGVKRKVNHTSELDTDTDNVGPVEVPPYDVNTERSANSVVTSEHYAKLQKGIEHVACRITNLLKKSEYRDASSVVKLVELTETRLAENKCEAIMVSVSGNMGSGKSTTINSIFGAGMIARSDKSGSSVTLVPHIYCGPLSDQSHRFIVEVQFYNKQQRKRFFEEELAAFYRAGRQDDFDDDDVDTKKAGGGDDDIDTRDTVTDAFHSIFLEQKECKTKRKMREFLKLAKSEDDRDMLKTLNKWADKLIARFAEDHESVMLQASTAQEMLNKVEIYSTEIMDDDSQRTLSLWPLVRLIKVHFDSPLSKMGVSILDAPGSSDNHIRRETALALKRECSHAAIVVGAARANSEGTVSKEVSAARGKGQGRIVVIVTGSDEIDPNTLIGGTNAERQNVDHLRQEIDRLQSESNALMLQFGLTLNSELLMKKMHVDSRLLRKQNEEKATRIAMRSHHTRMKLQEKLRDVIDSQEPVPVISVSNLDYQKHLLGFMSTQAPTLSVEQTNIPEVRRLFAEFPNEARRSEIKHLFIVNLPAAIGRVELFSARNTSDRKADIVLHVERATKLYGSYIETGIDRVVSIFEQEVLNRARTVEETWIKNADILCDDWRAAYKSSPFLALANRNGLKRNNKKSGPINLSGELVNIAGGRIQELFSLGTHMRINEEFDAILEDLHHLLSDVRKDIKSDDSAAFVHVQPFLDYITTQRPILEAIVKNRAKDFLAGVELMRAKMTTEVEDAYLVKTMLPVYEKVRVIKGGKAQIMEKPQIGWVAERHVVFKREVTALNGIWPNTCLALEQDFRASAEAAKSGLHKAVGGVFDRLVSTFDKDCDTADLDEPAQKALQALLRTCLQEVNEFVKRELDPAWEALSNGDR